MSSLGGSSIRSSDPSAASEYGALPLKEDAEDQATAMPASGQGLILLAIDDFQAIGSLFGEGVATALFYAAEARLWPALPDGAGSWPAGRGQFAISLPDITPHRLSRTARTLQARLAEAPLMAPSGDVAVTASAGCALAEARDLRHLGATAERALARAGRGGRGLICLLPAAPDTDSKLIRAAQQALAGDGLGIAFQPILPLTGEDPAFSGPPLYTECFVRLSPCGLDQNETSERDGDSTVPAGRFLGRLQAAGEAAAVDRGALHAALEHLAQAPQLRLGLNLSRETLLDKRWQATFDEAARAGLAVERLVFELDSRVIAGDPIAAGAFAERVRDAGPAIAVDRFDTMCLGTLRLESLRPDFLKINVSGGAPTVAGNIAACTALADRLDIPVVATGIGDAFTLDDLQAHGVSFAQGHYLARPSSVPPQSRSSSETEAAKSFRNGRGKALRYGSASH